ncbi:hypothetical protein [Pseudanabaena mucicola]|uniref:Uncharacterized protein n=1 Tax=Pseudanabaena mucicola FACHB-723 TaxID=2692860 RepID=A0ABR8A158_9CYAN|nr:hypothetical protein [Pseudanabaena mucicola]MBD2189779.1 hypothetical protein [Pseudanabaena mucicola FACHB-723]
MKHSLGKQSSQILNSTKSTTLNLQTRPFAPSQTDLDEEIHQHSQAPSSENVLEKLIATPSLGSQNMPIQRKSQNRLKLAQTKSNLAIQAKLSIGEPNDKYEKEADATAAKVVQQINSPTPSQSVQRQETLEEDELQMKPISRLQRDMMEDQMEEEEEEDSIAHEITHLTQHGGISRKTLQRKFIAAPKIFTAVSFDQKHLHEGKPTDKQAEERFRQRGHWINTLVSQAGLAQQVKANKRDITAGGIVTLRTGGGIAKVSTWRDPQDHDKGVKTVQTPTIDVKSAVDEDGKTKIFHLHDAEPVEEGWSTV